MPYLVVWHFLSLVPLFPLGFGQGQSLRAGPDGAVSSPTVPYCAAIQSSPAPFPSLGHTARLGLNPPWFTLHTASPRASCAIFHLRPKLGECNVLDYPVPKMKLSLVAAHSTGDDLETWSSSRKQTIQSPMTLTVCLLSSICRV